MRVGNKRLDPEIVEKIKALAGKESSMEVGMRFGIDHTSVLYWWNRLGTKSKSRRRAPNAGTKKTFKKTIQKQEGMIYEKILKDQQSKVFIRDRIGNLIKIVKSKILKT